MGDLPSFGDRQVYGGALAAPTYIDARVLATAGTAETVTVPTGACIVIFTPLYNNTVFFARYDGSAAAAPSADVSDGSGSEINPVARDIRNVATFSLVSPMAGATIIMAFYSDDAETPVLQ